MSAISRENIVRYSGVKNDWYDVSVQEAFPCFHIRICVNLSIFLVLIFWEIVEIGSTYMREIEGDWLWNYMMLIHLSSSPWLQNELARKKEKETFFRTSSTLFINFLDDKSTFFSEAIQCDGFCALIIRKLFVSLSFSVMWILSIIFIHSAIIIFIPKKASLTCEIEYF